MKKVVIFGGGSGLSRLLKGIRELDIDLTVVVTIADDGGSTGILRDLYDMPAPGDLRRVVLALSDRDSLEELMNYRFDDNLQEHTVGNIILAALTQIKGSMSKAVEEYCDLLDVKQAVLPISNESLKLVAQMKSGKIVYGESRIAKHEEQISEVGYFGKNNVNRKVIDKINECDAVIFSCGSLYTSILANLSFPEVSQALSNSEIKKIYVSNIMTQKGETENYNLTNHINAINKHLNGSSVDVAIANDNYDIPKEILVNYANESSGLVEIGKDSPCDIYAADFVEYNESHNIRHNVKRVAEAIVDILGEI